MSKDKKYYQNRYATRGADCQWMSIAKTKRNSSSPHCVPTQESGGHCASQRKDCHNEERCPARDRATEASPGAFRLRLVSNDDLIRDLKAQGALEGFLADVDQL